jgi:hypothetical protein
LSAAWQGPAGPFEVLVKAVDGAAMLDAYEHAVCREVDKHTVEIEIKTGGKEVVLR